MRAGKSKDIFKEFAFYCNSAFKIRQKKPYIFTIAEPKILDAS